jgi:hypothetical protein
VALLWETFERAEEKEISAQARRMMRVRSFLMYCDFLGTAWGSPAVV